MSRLWLVFTVKAVLGIYVGSKSEAATAPGMAMPAEITDLEAAVQAKYAGGLTLKAKQESDTSPAAPHVPADVTALEAAVAAKYGGGVTSDEVSQNHVHTLETAPGVHLPAHVLDLEAAVLAKYSMSKAGEHLQTPHYVGSGVGAPLVPAGVSALESAVVAKYGGSAALDAHTLETAPGVHMPAHLLDLEAAVLAKYSMSKAGDHFQVPPHVGSGAAAPQMPADVSALEAAVAAKYGGSAASNVHTLETAPGVHMPAHLLDLEAAVLAKYSMSKAGDHELQTPKNAGLAVAAPQVPVEVSALEAAVAAKYGGSPVSGEVSQNIVHMLETAPGVHLPAHLLDLEAAVLAKYSMSRAGDHKLQIPQDAAVDSLQTAPDASVSIQEPRVSGASLEVPPEVAKLEAAVLKKYTTGSLLSTAKQDAATISDKAKQNSSSNQTVPEVSAEVAKLEAAVLAKYSDKVPSDEAQKAPPVVAADPTKAPTPAPENRSQHVLMADRPSITPWTPQRSGMAATEIAHKRAEVEDVFHLSKVADSKVLQPEALPSSGRSPFRFILLVVLVLSLLGVAHHKYEVISQIAGPKLHKSKAKCEDFDAEGGCMAPEQNYKTCGADEARQSRWPSSPSGFRTSLTSVVNSSHQTIARRAGKSGAMLPM